MYICIIAHVYLYTRQKIKVMEFYIIFVLLLTLDKGIYCESYKPRIAIIGGGIGGAACSHFLTELFENNLDIDLYEAKTIGGRLATVQINNYEFEAGGSIIHPQNKYMQEFAKLLGLEHRVPSYQRTSIWNGNETVFKESKWELLSFAKLIYRYGIQPFSLSRYVASVISNFENIYQQQDARKTFKNTTDFLSALNIEYPKLMQKPIKEELLNLGYSEQVIDELVKTTLVVNYGQDTNVQSFVGFVSLAGAGSNLWSVKGGNKKVPEHLIYRNKHVNIVPSQVTRIVYAPINNVQNSYEVFYHNKDSTITMKAVYDIIILAIPLTNDQEFPIIFEGFPKNDFYSNEKYHQTVATFVQANLNPYYFGLTEELDSVLSCNPKKTIINSVGRLSPVDTVIKNSNIWKIFSNKPLKIGIIEEMFSNIQERKEIIWKAYPEYSTKIHKANFKLHNALYHVNAIEWIASAMEMSAISARNIALLAYNDFSDKNCLRNVVKERVSENTPSIEL